MVDLIKAGRSAILALPLVSLAGATAAPPETGVETSSAPEGEDRTQSADFQRGREEGIKAGIEIGKRLGQVSFSLDAIDRSVAGIELIMSRVRDEELRRDWQVDKNKIEGNLRLIRRKMESGYLDIELAGSILEMTIKDLDQWNKTLEEMQLVPRGEVGSPAPASQAASGGIPSATQSPLQGALGEISRVLPEPDLSNTQVVMPLGDYAAYRIIQRLGGINAIVGNLEESQSLIREYLKYFEPMIPQGGIGRAIGDRLNQEAARYPDGLRGAIERDYERQRSERDSR